MSYSVLLPVYKKEKPSNLVESINSILNQSLAPNEIVIVEDGPLTPELDLLLESYSSNDNRFKLVKLKKNCGLGLALNHGLAACSNEIILRMDSDDVALLTRCEEQVTHLLLHPETVIISSNVIEFEGDISNVLSYKVVPERHSDISVYMRRRNPINHMAVCYRKAAILEVGGYEDCPFFEDYYLWVKVMSKGGKFYNIQKPLVYARAGSALISRRGGWKYVRYILHFQIKAYKVGGLYLSEMITNSILRTVVALVPITFRKPFYNKVLREKNE